MIVGVIKETFSSEARVALVPSALKTLARKKLEVIVESGAGVAAGFVDAAFEAAGAKLKSRKDVLAEADIIVQVRSFGSNADAGKDDLGSFKKGQVVIGFMDPLGSPQHARTLAETGVTALSMELMPRITRAQSMDALSSMATLAGYKAVLLAANHLPKIFPMMMTAAGSISPAKVFVIGAGVAGLQAIATAKRLGAVVEAYDVRPEVKEQVQSVGGKFVELEIDSSDSGDGGGYAKAQSEDFYKKQQELMTARVQAADVVITTAAIPGRRSPLLVPKAMVDGMRPGSVIIDLAAEGGGNCELTEAGKSIEVNGVTVVGPTNVPALLPYDASQMYAKNIVTFLSHLVDKEGALNLDREDEITKETLVAFEGQVVHERVRSALDEAVAGECLMTTFIMALTVFVLAMFLGFEFLITKVPPTLHTPLMSGSNAISGITLIGAVLAVSTAQRDVATWLGLAAVIVAAINAVGGFLVTHRMLAMFKSQRAGR